MNRIIYIVILAVIVTGIVMVWVWLPHFGPARPLSWSCHIVVDKSKNTLYVFDRGRTVAVFPVATGRQPDYTPEGWFRIVDREVEPGGPFGDRWLGLAVPGHEDGETYGIHGTDEPDSIGHHASSGCIRMHNEDVTQLDRLVKPGVKVFIRR